MKIVFTLLQRKGMGWFAFIWSGTVCGLWVLGFFVGRMFLGFQRHGIKCAGGWMIVQWLLE